MSHLVGFDALMPGLRVSAIRYDLHQFELPPANTSSFDGTSVVSIDFVDGGIARFQWRFDHPLHEDLWVGPPQFGDPIREFLDVDRTSRWQLAGATLVGHAVGLQETDGGGPGVLTPWACRLDFDGDRHLVIALGERTPEGSITYLPDSLIVTDLRDVACGYRHVATEWSAWCGEC